jgi:prolyl-tRNA synthetase
MAFTSSGLDLGALTAAVAELHCDGSGIIWPRRIAPFQVHLVGLNLEKDDLNTQAEKLYQDLLSAGLSVLFDDRHVRAGEKFGDADLLGVPLRVTLSSRTLAEGQVELKLRNRDEAERLALDEAVQALQSRADGRGLRVDG